MLGTQSKWQKFGHAVHELEFITALFSWIFNLLSRVAEPLMTLAVIYTIIVSGLPQTMVPMLYNLALAIMIGAPEVILPGAFIMAGQQQQGGNKRAWMLFGICILFIALTSLTLADLFIFHFNQVGTSVLMCARCVAGVSYSILVRVVNHEQHLPEPENSQPFDHQVFMTQVLHQVQQMNQQLVQDIHASQEQFRNQFVEKSQKEANNTAIQLEQALEPGVPLVEQEADEIDIKPQSPRLRLLTSVGAGKAFTGGTSQSLLSHEDVEDEGHEIHASRSVHAEELPFIVREEAELQTDTLHIMPEVQREDSIHESSPTGREGNGGRANREQVSAFILNYWREHHVRPTIKCIRANTGCSQGLASECCKLVAQEMNPKE